MDCQSPSIISFRLDEEDKHRYDIRTLASCDSSDEGANNDTFGSSDDGRLSPAEGLRGGARRKLLNRKPSDFKLYAPEEDPRSPALLYETSPASCPVATRNQLHQGWTGAPIEKSPSPVSDSCTEASKLPLKEFSRNKVADSPAERNLCNLSGLSKIHEDAAEHDQSVTFISASSLFVSGLDRRKSSNFLTVQKAKTGVSNDQVSASGITTDDLSTGLSRKHARLLKRATEFSKATPQSMAKRRSDDGVSGYSNQSAHFFFAEDDEDEAVTLYDHSDSLEGDLSPKTASKAPQSKPVRYFDGVRPSADSPLRKQVQETPQFLQERYLNSTIE